jgi:hypothetical protein
VTRERDELPDWFLGGAGKRRLVHAVVHPERWTTESPPWSKKALARLAGLEERHAASRHVEILDRAGLLVRENASYRLNDASPLVDPLRALTDVLDGIDSVPLPPARGGRST